MVATAALVFSSTAFAQAMPPPPSPSQTPPPPVNIHSTMGTRNDYRQGLQAWDMKKFESQPAAAEQSARSVADCLARHAKAKAGELVGGPMTDDPKYDHLMRALTGKYNVCFTAEARGLPMYVLNGALAEQIVRGENRAFKDFDTPADNAAAAAFYASAGGPTMDSVGRCLAIYSPGLVYRVIAAPAGTPQETSAMSTVYSETPLCNVRTPPKGIPTSEQRAAMAVGLYAWTHRS